VGISSIRNGLEYKLATPLMSPRPGRARLARPVLGLFRPVLPRSREPPPSKHAYAFARSDP
jgi:hypothetical protein